MNKENYIKFDRDFVGKVIDGIKTQTIRLGESYLIEGEIVELQTANGNKFDEALITGIEEVKAGEIPQRNFDGHQNYENFDEFGIQMSEYYEEHITPETQFFIVSFTVVE